MNVVYETAIYYYQSRGGISRLYNEIIPIVCTFDDINVSIVATQKVLQPLPSHPKLQKIDFSKVNQILKPRRIWHKVYEEIAANKLGYGKNRLLHSTYYRALPHWKGYKVITVYDMIYEKYPNLFASGWDHRLRMRKKRAIRDADMVVCISESTAQSLQEFYPVDKSRIVSIALGYSSDIFRQVRIENIPDNYKISFPFILYVGSRSKYKNFIELLNAYSSWVGNREVFLVAVGPAWESDELSKLSKLGLKDKVILYEDIDDQMLSFLYNQAVAFVYPSQFEGFGIPLLESMACGCPIIASQIPSTIEVANTLPLYFEFGRPDSLHVAFDKALSEGRNSDRITSGLDHVKQFSWEKTALETISCYRRLLN